MFLENSQSSQENTCARASFLIKLQAEAVKKMFLKISQNSQENIFARDFFLIKWQAWKETLAQVFSYEFYKISKNNFSYRTPPVASFESVAYILRALSRKNHSESKKLSFYLIADWINFMYFHTALFIVFFETENAISFYYDFTYISEAVTGDVL